MDEPHCHGTLPHSRRNSLDRARVDVADREDARPAGLEEQGAIAVVLDRVLTVDVAAGQEKPGPIGRQLVLEPFGMR